jgi:hypothetical protein
VLRNASCLLIGDPLRDPRVQNVERQGSGIEHFIMKGADVVLRAEILLRLLAKLDSFTSPASRPESCNTSVPTR